MLSVTFWKEAHTALKRHPNGQGTHDRPMKYVFTIAFRPLVSIDDSLPTYTRVCIAEVAEDNDDGKLSYVDSDVTVDSETRTRTKRHEPIEPRDKTTIPYFEVSECSSRSQTHTTENFGWI